MRELARAGIDRRPERDLADLRPVGLARLAGVLVRQPYGELGADGRTADRHVAQADVAAELRGVPRRCQVADRVAAVGVRHQPEVGSVIVDRPAADGHADHRHLERRAAGVDLFADALQRRLADVVGLLLARHLIGKVALERHRLMVDVLAPGHDAGLDAALMARRDDHQPVRLARLQHRVPQLLRVQGGVAQIDLVALLAGEARLGDHYAAAGDHGFHDAVVGNAADAFAYQIDHQRLRLGPLDLHRADVDLVDLDVHAHTDVDPLQPVEQVGIGEREPELVLCQAQQHRVVEDAAPLVAEDDVLAVHRLDAAGVAGDDVVGEPLRVRSLDADLTLDRDVPERDVMRQRLVLGGGAPVLRPHVAARMVDAIVDRGAPAAGRVRQMPVGRLAHARGDEQLRGGAPALAQVDRNDAVGLVDAVRLAGHACFLLGARLNGSRANTRRTIGSKNESGSES